MTQQEVSINIIGILKPVDNDSSPSGENSEYSVIQLPYYTWDTYFSQEEHEEIEYSEFDLNLERNYVRDAENLLVGDKVQYYN